MVFQSSTRAPVSGRRRPSSRLKSAAIAAGVAFALVTGALQTAPALAQSTLQLPLAPGDILEFAFLDNGELPRQVTVGPDGRIPAPLIGGFSVSGLTVTGALEALQKAYLERRFLVDPSKVSLVVVSYRPVFVLGDVRTPGSFPFKSALTVEQAVGLAGGFSVGASSVEQSLMTTARLRSEIASLEAEIAREAMVAARATAQIANRSSVTFDDMPAAARPYVSNFEALRKVSDEMLAHDAAAFKTQKQLLSENVVEASRELSTLDELVVNQKKTIKFSQEDQDRTSTLLKSGLTRASELSRVERQLTSDQGRLLNIYSQMSSSRRAIGDLKRQLATLEDTRRRDALNKLEEQQIKIDKLVNQRKSAVDQLVLSANFYQDEQRRNTSPAVEFKIRRRIDDRQQDVVANSLSDVLPGDVVIVTVQRPDQPIGTANAKPVADATVTR